VLAVANSARLGMGKFALVDALRAARSTRLMGQHFTARAGWPQGCFIMRPSYLSADVSSSEGRELLLEGLLDLFGIRRNETGFGTEDPMRPGCGLLGCTFR
jgi:hypothetical protein